MAAATEPELDFVLASFWEFGRIWRAGKTCTLVLSCDGGRGVVAGLGAAGEAHLPPQVIQVQKHGRKKTPSQLRCEERRRNEKKAEKATQGEAAAQAKDSGLAGQAK